MPTKKELLKALNVIMATSKHIRDYADTLPIDGFEWDDHQFYADEIEYVVNGLRTTIGYIDKQAWRHRRA